MRFTKKTIYGLIQAVCCTFGNFISNIADHYESLKPYAMTIYKVLFIIGISSGIVLFFWDTVKYLLDTAKPKMKKYGFRYYLQFRLNGIKEFIYEPINGNQIAFIKNNGGIYDMNTSRIGAIKNNSEVYFIDNSLIGRLIGEHYNFIQLINKPDKYELKLPPIKKVNIKPYRLDKSKVDYEIVRMSIDIGVYLVGEKDLLRIYRDDDFEIKIKKLL